MSVKPKWIVDKHITRDTRYENLDEIIATLGYDVSVMEYKPFLNSSEYELPYDKNDCVILYSTIDLARKIKGYFGLFLNEDALKYHKYISNTKIPLNDFLNSDFVITTFYDFRINLEKYKNIFNTDQLFIRPDSGSKLFAGFRLDPQTTESQIHRLIHMSGAVDDTLIIVAKGKNIVEEARFIIVGNQVIDGSRYQVDGVHIEDRNVSQDMIQLANRVANCQNPPEEIYTCDIARLSNGQYKIVELNSFSCAGWYACDPKLVVTKVSKYVEKLYKEQNEDVR